MNHPLEPDPHQPINTGQSCGSRETDERGFSVEAEARKLDEFELPRLRPRPKRTMLKKIYYAKSAKTVSKLLAILPLCLAGCLIYIGRHQDLVIAISSLVLAAALFFGPLWFGQLSKLWGKIKKKSVTSDLEERTPPPPDDNRHDDPGGLDHLTTDYRDLGARLVTSAVGMLSAHSGIVGPSMAYAASSAGQSHLAEGLPREDSYALSSLNSRFGSAAVADGVGTSRDAHVAAFVVAQLAVRMINDWHEGRAHGSWQQLGYDLVALASEQLKENKRVEFTRNLMGYVPSSHAARQKHAAPSTTLAAVAFEQKQDYLDINWLTFGDCAVLSLEDGRWEWLSGFPDRLAQSTPALPGKATNLKSGRTSLDNRGILVLATDGFADAIDLHPRGLADAITSAIEERVSVAKFCTLLDFDIGGLYDDKTVVLLMPRGLGRPA